MSEKSIVWRKLDDLQLWGDNPNQGDVGAILTSINRFGYNESIVVWYDRVQGGNHRVMALRQLWKGGWRPSDKDRAVRLNGDGLEVAAWDISHLETEQEANAFGLALNRTTRRGVDDSAKLAALLQDIKAVDEQSFVASGYDGDDLDELLREIGQLGEPPKDPGAQVDRAGELQQKWQTERGQLWVVGKHRILCGDSTDVDDVERLMDGRKVQGAFTSPPYAMQREKQYGGIAANEYIGWWDGVQGNVKDNLLDDGSFFVNIKPHCEDGERVLYVMDLVLAMKRLWGWRLVDELCWLRVGFPGKFNRRFRNAFEPVYHFALDKEILFNPQNVLIDSAVSKGHSPGNPSWNNQTGSGFPGVDFDDAFARPSNVLDMKMVAYGYPHAAMFPLKLPAFFVKAYSDDGDSWFDPFLGSGTTLAACEQTQRIGYGMEIAPEYVAVSLERLSQMGLEPRLSND